VVSGKEEQYARAASGWSDREYADTGAYLSHRAALVRDLGPRLEPGDEVLDLACGDGGLGEALLALGLGYRGVDATPEMVEAARARLGGRASVEHGDLDSYVPPVPVAATTVFRAIYYASDRTSLFTRAASFTTSKLVFDLNPRQFALEEVLADLARAGLTETALRPFFVPQRLALPGPLASLLRAGERSGVLARLLLRARFTYVVAAWSP
jgi:SAM-dependent methyltransferase